MIVKETAGMLGLFSTRAFQKGEIVISSLVGPEIAQPTRTSVQIGPQTHIDVKDNCRYMNHSCDPNTEMKNGQFVALKTIEPGAEITFDYNASEDVLSNPFVCRDCGQMIRGKLLHKKALEMP